MGAGAEQKILKHSVGASIPSIRVGFSAQDAVNLELLAAGSNHARQWRQTSYWATMFSQIYLVKLWFVSTVSNRWLSIYLDSFPADLHKMRKKDREREREREKCD